MIQGKWFSPGSDLSDLLPVRTAVFGRGSDALDNTSWNVLVYQDSVPVAVGRRHTAMQPVKCVCFPPVT